MQLILIGAGYIGSVFASEAERRGWGVRRVTHDEAQSWAFRYSLSCESNDFRVVVNCAAYIKDGRADSCEDNKADTVLGNLVLPARLADACYDAKVPLLHVSTACMYNGDNGGTGWTEEHTPQLSWRARSDCGTYVASKQLAEEVLLQQGYSWICRVRLPFDNIDNPRNFLSKIRNYEKVYDNINSLAHRGEFVEACLSMIEKRVPFGIYNVLNPGAIWTHDIIDMMNRREHLKREFVYWDDKEFMELVARTPKSNCTISVKKLLATGIKMRQVGEAVEHSLDNWYV
ncbi:MAG: NAD-dependent epimerase/dehydratase family protein [Desulfurellales bacterium]|nr:MAG: NAD-dependent epimerase/dehydratase family protein [Desulfurellales bacterium]